jgi:hypothetical protein
MKGRRNVHIEANGERGECTCPPVWLVAELTLEWGISAKLQDVEADRRRYETNDFERGFIPSLP